MLVLCHIAELSITSNQSRNRLESVPLKVSFHGQNVACFPEGHKITVLDEIVQTSETVTLVGGGATHDADLKQAVSIGPVLVAADGGAATALRAGMIPHAIIGDFDSLPKGLAAEMPQDRLHKIAEQDSTDFDKALRNIKAPLVLAVGFTGARLDHQLAAFHTLARYPDRPCLLLGQQEIVCIAPPDISVDLAAGEIVSLFPMGPVTGRSEGLKWPIDGLEFAPDTYVGISNQATGPVRLWFDAPKMLLILPRRIMPQVAGHWLTSRARWPAL